MPAIDRARALATAAEQLVSDVAAEYDESLVVSSVRLLHRLQAASGKTCQRCRVRKPLSAFTRDARNADALRNYCRACDMRTSKRAKAN